MKNIISTSYKSMIFGFALISHLSFSQSNTYLVTINGETFEKEYPQVSEFDYCKIENRHLHRFCGENTLSYTDLFQNEEPVKVKSGRQKNISSKNKTYHLYTGKQRSQILERDKRLREVSHSLENNPILAKSIDLDYNSSQGTWSSSTKLNSKEVIRLFTILNQETEGQFLEYSLSQNHISSQFNKNLDQRCYDLLEEIGQLKEQKNITDSSTKSAIFFNRCTT
ncbi:hypothetical protein N9N67_01695 [Bacteriovoracaceae bacterium]|nr:hypothetical protein [Bacteriovoracaceae bacterium]